MSPVVSNRGNYTFSATNDVGTTNLTYRTFFGSVYDLCIHPLNHSIHPLNHSIHPSNLCIHPLNHSIHP